MAWQQLPRNPDGSEELTRKTADQQRRRAWERPTVENVVPSPVRATFRTDAPSPCQEILAKHDADLQERGETDELPTQIVCF